MTISRELWGAYTRIFFVETAYWIISIGMVFVNEFVLSDIFTSDLTVFITLFQILFSLAILVTLNHITKHYLYPNFEAPKSTKSYYQDHQNRLMQNDDVESETVLDDQDGEHILFLSQNAKSSTQDDKEYCSSKQKTSTRAKTLKKNFNKSVNEQSSDSSSQDSLSQLFMVNIPHRMSLETCKIVFPLSILYIGMLLMNNFCLKNVGVAFYFVSRSLTTVFNVIFTYFLIREPVSIGALVCCGFIILGFILGVDQENVIGSLSVIGVIFGVASSLFTSLFSIYTKKTLTKLDRNIWVLVLYNNVNATLLCAPLLLVHGDVQALISDKVISPSFWSLLSISGIMAFFISIVTNASIKYTSPLTHNISGTAKACFQTVIAVIFSDDHKSSLWWLSNLTILIASATYSRIRQIEMERRTNASSTTSSDPLSQELNAAAPQMSPFSKGGSSRKNEDEEDLLFEVNDTSETGENRLKLNQNEKQQQTTHLMDAAKKKPESWSVKFPSST